MDEIDSEHKLMTYSYMNEVINLFTDEFSMAISWSTSTQSNFSDSEQSLSDQKKLS